MQITATFENTQEMMEFCRMMAGKEVSTGQITPTVGSAIAGRVEKSAAVTAPTAGRVEKSAVVTAPTAVPVSTPTQAVPVTQPAPTAAPTAPVTPSVTGVGQVPTTTQTYELDDLARAAMTLMDVGRQGELQQLLTQFGVAALPMLPKDQYGAFATALRGMGAQI